MLQSIKKIRSLKGKRVLLRADFNVPIVSGRVRDPFRIDATLPTINFLRKKGAKIIIISHVGKGGDSLKPVSKYLSKKLPHLFISDFKTPKAKRSLDSMKNGSVLLLENLRLNLGEEKNSASFAKDLAGLGDIYVNDAFPVSHRAHASIVGVPKYLPHYMGFQFEKEIKHLSYAFKPAQPLLLILGGAKFDTKLPLIEHFQKTADIIFVGGALANTFYKIQGFEIGKSLVDSSTRGLRVMLKEKNIIIAPDAIVSSGNKRKIVCDIGIGKNDIVNDVGPESLALLESLSKKSKTIIWNGPLGRYEDGFGGSTETLLKILAKSKAKVIIGGGDTTALVSKLKLENKFFFVSTGGGATLEYLSRGTLPGLEALEK